MIGLCSVTFRGRSPEEVIEIAREAGLEAIEWGGDEHVPAGDLKNAERIAELTEEAGLVTSSYGSYYKVGSREDFETVLETAAALKIKTIRVWAGDKESEKADDNWRKTVVEEAERIAGLAQDRKMSISFEYHSGTLTDTPESAYQLMKSIQAENVFLYWQPSESLTVEERKSSLALLGEWITNVHVFHWEDYENRFALEEGKEEWSEYISSLLTHSPYSHNYLLEFVKNDDPEQLKQDAETLKRLVGD